jgi:hypothetical protein
MDELLRCLAQLFPETERTEMVIFGSAAIVLQGVDIGRSVGDLDVFVSQATFEALAVRFGKQEKPGSDGPVPFIAPARKIEILASFPGVEFPIVAKRGRPNESSYGFPVGCLDDLRTWKAAQGREKDFRDIEAIDRHLSRSGAEKSDKGNGN